MRHLKGLRKAVIGIKLEVHDGEAKMINVKPRIREIIKGFGFSLLGYSIFVLFIYIMVTTHPGSTGPW
jgi:hypothetical protein